MTDDRSMPATFRAAAGTLLILGLAGVIAGIQTQPAVLAFASERTPAEQEVNLGYASVYPLAVIAKIVVAQVMLRILVG